MCDVGIEFWFENCAGVMLNVVAVVVGLVGN